MSKKALRNIFIHFQSNDTMPTLSEIAKIIAWCEFQIKKEGRLVQVVRNPFRDEIPWTYRHPLIEINRPLEVADKSNLVYDSSTKTLWRFFLGQWRRVEPDFEIKE